jgi:arginine decarboxylase
MLPTKAITMAAATVGHAEGGTPLNAFDNALLAAGIGNVNLVKVSSIVPPDVAIVELPKIRSGGLVPTAYAAVTSEVPGQTVAAAVGYALPDDPTRPGVIMEYHDIAGRPDAERAVRAMLEEAFGVRREPIRELRVFAVEHTVARVGCALAAVVLLAEQDLA